MKIIQTISYLALLCFFGAQQAHGADYGIAVAFGKSSDVDCSPSDRDQAVLNGMVQSALARAGLQDMAATASNWPVWTKGSNGLLEQQSPAVGAPGLANNDAPGLANNPHGGRDLLACTDDCCKY